MSCKSMSCFAGTFNSVTLLCKLYQQLSLAILVANTSSVTFVRISAGAGLETSVTDGLTHFWPVKNDLRDYAGDADLIPMQNVNLAPDRFGNPNSSLHLKRGYCSVKPGVYFNEADFTITVWVKPILARPNNYYTLLDFGNGVGVDNVYFGYFYNNQANVYIYDQQGNNYNVSTRPSVKIGAWVHLAVSMVASTSKVVVYVNAKVGAQAPINFSPSKVNRSNCMIGRSSWFSNKNNPDAVAYLDDIRIYSIALSQDQIRSIYSEKPN